MRKTPLLFTAVALFLIASLLFVMGCKNQLTNESAREPENASITHEGQIDISGTVVYKELEGGFFAIEGDGGKIYDPINLPDAFKKDGLKVNVNARLRNDMGSIRMVGDIIEIIDITAE